MKTPKTPMLVYVAGPYRANTAFGREENIFNARRVGAMLARNGFFPVIPHANTAHFDGLQEDEFWLEGTLEMMRRCDAVYMMPNWRASKGAVAERDEAINLSIPVCNTMEELRKVQDTAEQAAKDFADAIMEAVDAALRQSGAEDTTLVAKVYEEVETSEGPRMVERNLVFGEPDKKDIQ
jgi:nucleoside 2-deoxyribosyltransferase